MTSSQVTRPWSFRASRLAPVMIAFVLAAGSCTRERPVAPDVRPQLPGSVRLVGHEPLFARGMNAGLAVWNGYAYVGNRTDGSPSHQHAGVLVVDVSDPARPHVVGEIGPPQEGNLGETSRELRVWPAQGLLIVLNFGCDPLIHSCQRIPVQATVHFYDITGSHARSPRLVSTYEPSRLPHEFFLWLDPHDSARALLYLSTPGFGEQLLVTDISQARVGRFPEIGTWGASFPDRDADDTLHSMSVSSDGRWTYLAHLTAGFLVLDTSAIAESDPNPRIHTLTALDSRPQWAGAGPHSAVPVSDRDLALTTDEVYGGSAGGGCPWGWVRLIDVSDVTEPSVVSEYRVTPYNLAEYCGEVDEKRDMSSSFSSHNPTVTDSLALISWHSAGLQVISIEDAQRPRPVAEFIPQSLPSVGTEDPMLSSGRDKVVFWSYPIIVDGLIYVVDIRNGLFILAYDGPHQSEIDEVTFLEGNSNVGEARS